MRLFFILSAIFLLTACGGSGNSSTTNVPTPYSSTYMQINLIDGSALASTTNPGVTSNTLTFERISPTLYMGVYEVTQKQWTQVMATTPWTAVPSAVAAPITADAAPAYNLSWDDAQAFVDRVSAQTHLRIQIMSESQWRNAIGSGTYPWGNDLAVSAISANAWVNESRSTAGPTTVGARAAAASGLYDLVGNVREWTAEKTLVGGSWADNIVVSGKTEFMSSVDPDIRHPLCGIRVVAIP